MEGLQKYARGEGSFNNKQNVLFVSTSEYIYESTFFWY